MASIHRATSFCFQFGARAGLSKEVGAYFLCLSTVRVVALYPNSYPLPLPGT
jgi:hypothetical protein